MSAGQMDQNSSHIDHSYKMSLLCVFSGVESECKMHQNSLHIDHSYSISLDIHHETHSWCSCINFWGSAKSFQSPERENMLLCPLLVLVIPTWENERLTEVHTPVKLMVVKHLKVGCQLLYKVQRKKRSLKEGEITRNQFGLPFGTSQLVTYFDMKVSCEIILLWYEIIMRVQQFMFLETYRKLIDYRFTFRWNIWRFWLPEPVYLWKKHYSPWTLRSNGGSNHMLKE